MTHKENRNNQKKEKKCRRRGRSWKPKI